MAMKKEKGSVSIDAQNIMPVIKRWLYSDKDIFLREAVSNACDAITKSGAFFSYGDQRIAQGRDNARVYLREHPELTDEIDKKVRAILFAPKDLTPDEAKAVEAQKQEEEDDLALLEEDI